MNLDIWHNRGNKISANVSASSLSVFVNVYLRWLIRHTLSSRPSVMKWFKKMIRKIIYDIRWVIRMCDLWYNVLLCVLAVQGAALVTEPRAQVQVQILCYCTFPPHIWTQMSKFSPFCIFGKRLVTLFWMPLRGIMDSVSLHLDFLIFSLLLLGMLYQPNMWLFDVLGMRLNSQLSLWCV